LSFGFEPTTIRGSGATAWLGTGLDTHRPAPPAPAGSAVCTHPDPGACKASVGFALQLRTSCRKQLRAAAANELQEARELQQRTEAAANFDFSSMAWIRSIGQASIDCSSIDALHLKCVSYV